MVIAQVGETYTIADMAIAWGVEMSLFSELGVKACEYLQLE